MRVLITGGSGFIGTRLGETLKTQGHEVRVLDLRAPSYEAEFVKADLAKHHPPAEAFAGVAAVIHLAGKNIYGRWSEETKKAIYDSRVEGTRNLVSALKTLPEKPGVLVSASAMGYYGDRGEEGLREYASPGKGFLATVAKDWEYEAGKAEVLGIRTVQIRTAPVLGKGGLLSTLLPLFRLGLGGSIGTGRQWFSWIHLEDLVSAYRFAAQEESVQGPVNACAPEQVRFEEFAKTLAGVLHRPAFFTVPSWLLRLRFGEFADEMVASQKAYPDRLQEHGYQFRFPKLKEALEDILK